MNCESFLNEVEIFADGRDENIDKIKSHGLPVIIFGAGEMAKWVTNHLKFYGIEVDGYAVDAEFFKPNQKLLERPIYNFAEISAEKYVFVLGMEDEMQGGHRAIDFLCNEKIICYPLPINLEGSSEKIDLKFIKDNQNKFQETFNMLEDELSRQTLISFLKLKLTGDWSLNLNVFQPGPYFNEITAAAKTGGGVEDT